MTDQELVKTVIEQQIVKSFAALGDLFYRDASQFSRVAAGKQRLANEKVRAKLQTLIREHATIQGQQQDCVEQQQSCAQPI